MKARKADSSKAVAKAASAAGGPEKPIRKKPDRLRERWNTALSSGQTLAVAQLLWDTVFTDREKELLGGVSAVVELGAPAMWRKVRGGTDRQAVVSIAIAVGLVTAADGKAILAEFGEAVPDAEGRLAQAIAEGGLVLVGVRREMYWKKVLVPIDWRRHGASWEFIYELAQKATSGASLDALTLSAASEARIPGLRSIKSRLVNLKGFPTHLKNCIRRAGLGTYLLELPRGDVRVFTVLNTDELVELNSKE